MTLFLSLTNDCSFAFEVQSDPATSSSLEHAYVETACYISTVIASDRSSLEHAYVETLCEKSSVPSVLTSEFAVDRQSCKNALQIDSKVLMQACFK